MSLLDFYMVADDNITIRVETKNRISPPIFQGEVRYIPVGIIHKRVIRITFSFIINSIVVEVE